MSARVGYHASHEQLPPSELLELVLRAERAGFRGAMCSEHLFPWSDAQGHSGNAWCWLGAAMQATSLPMGLVTAPGYRQHPTMVAQAAATLEEMFPGRAWIAIGSGEALNEHVTGAPWPRKAERDARLRECGEIMRRLWAGEWVTHRGAVTVIDAKLWSLPARPPRMLVAAITPATAAWAAGWADGMITVSRPRDELRAVVDAFRRGGGEGKPMVLQVKVSWAEREADALAGAREQWATNVFPSSVASDLALPQQYEALARDVTDEQLRRVIRISSELERHAEWLREDVAMGFDEIYVHGVNPPQREIIDAFGQRVLPVLT